jgi:hypothetical protein
MTNKITFVNDTPNRTQICVTVNDLGVRNFQLFAGDTDNLTSASAGDDVHFWWRDDGNPCKNCSDANPPCSLNTFVMLNSDVGVRLLGDNKWSKQTI